MDVYSSATTLSCFTTSYVPSRGVERPKFGATGGIGCGESLHFWNGERHGGRRRASLCSQIHCIRQVAHSHMLKGPGKDGPLLSHLVESLA